MCLFPWFFEYHYEGQIQDLHIQSERFVLYIPDIQFKFLFPSDRGASVNLRPACDAGHNIVTHALFSIVQFEILRKQRSWSYEAHIAFQNIPKLRDFVQ